MDAMVQTDYTAHLDAKNRLTIRGAKYVYYQVKEYANGCIADTRTAAQKDAMFWLIINLHHRFPDIKVILGHRDLPGVQKACPCFDATKLQPLLEV